MTVRGAAIFVIFSFAMSIVPMASFAAADMRAVLTLRVNTVTKFDVTVKMRDNDILVTRGDLEQAGLQRIEFHGAKTDEFVSLQSLRPAVTYNVDDKALTLDLTVSPENLEVSLFSYSHHQEVAIAKPARSVFANYSVGFSSDAKANFSGEVGTRVGAGMLDSSATFAGNGTYNTHVTHWIFDRPSSDIRMTIGDANISTGDLGSYAMIDGAVVQRYFGMNPNTVEYVLPGVRGSVGTPATADIYVNGTLVKQETLPPGQFNFQNLPVGLGPNNTQIVVTDAFGRQQTYSNYFYGSDQLLAKGVSNFAYAAGVPRAQYGQTPATSGLALAGRYAAGVTPNLTLGGRAEAGGSLISGGGEAIFRLHQAVIGIDAAGSRFGAVGGAAAALSYQEMSRGLGFAASLLMQSPGYATLSQRPEQDRTLTDASISISVPGQRSDVGLTYSALRDRNNGMQHEWQLTRWTTVSPRLSFSVNATLTSGSSGRTMGISSTVNFIPRSNSTAYVSMSDLNGRNEVSANLAKGAPQGVNAFGYNVGLTEGQGIPVSGYGMAQYRWPYGVYFANVNAGAGAPATLGLQLAGGLVAIGRGLFATQPLTDSYALISTGGLSGVRVTANGMDEGRTNRAGYVIVPQIASYSANTISLDPSDIPMNYEFDAAARQVTPAYRSGSIVQFGMKRVLPVTGTLHVLMQGRTTIPAYGILYVESATLHATSDIGENGEFYFDMLPTGVYRAQIQFKGGRCSFQISIPATNTNFLKLGSMTCQNGEAI